jgi:hypothetical protein
MLDAKMRPAFVIVADKLDRASALDLERKTISKIGRRCLGTGPLTNVGDGGWCNSTINGERADLWLDRILKTRPELASETNTGAMTFIKARNAKSGAVATESERRARAFLASRTPSEHLDTRTMP